MVLLRVWAATIKTLSPQKSAGWCGGWRVDPCLRTADSEMGYRGGGGLIVWIKGMGGLISVEEDFVGDGGLDWVLVKLDEGVVLLEMFLRL